eukprot:13300370-Ditylum_brightwellii.AAC.1
MSYWLDWHEKFFSARKAFLNASLPSHATWCSQIFTTVITIIRRPVNSLQCASWCSIAPGVDPVAVILCSPGLAPSRTHAAVLL